MTEALTLSRGNDEFGLFVAGIQGRLQRTAWLLTGNWAEAEDLVQSSLAKVWRRWDRVCETDSPEAYARKLLLNTFLSSRRRRWIGERADEAPQPAPVGDPADLVAVQVSVRSALARLSSRQRAAVVLRFFDDLSETQVAEALGCRVGTVKSTTAKALERLRIHPGMRQLLQEAQP